MNSQTEKALLLAFEALLRKNLDKPSKEAREAVLDALEAGGYRWPRSDDGRF